MIPSAIHRALVFPVILHALGAYRGFKSAQSDLRRLERGTTKELHHWLEICTADIVAWAARHTEFYPEHWKRLDGPESQYPALVGVPLLTKGDLQHSLPRMRSGTSVGRLTIKTTGGSTGQPVTIAKDRYALGREIGAQWHAYGWYGLRPGDPWARLWGNPSVTRRRFKYKLADVATNRRTLSAFGFDRSVLQSYDSLICRGDLAFLYGYVSMLRELAEIRVSMNHPQNRPPGLKAIVTTSEVLSSSDRLLMQNAFGVPVHNEYGCGEVGPIAYECEAGTLHVLSANLAVEVIGENGRQAGPGESGEVVVTDLSNHATPLIRYRLGDWAEVAGDCGCGRPLPGLSRVWGRAYDTITLPDGRRYHGEYFMYLAEDLRARGVPLDQFQVTQTAPGALSVSVVIPDAAADEAIARISAELGSRLPGLRVDVDRVKSISREPSGKMRLIRGLESV